MPKLPHNAKMRSVSARRPYLRRGVLALILSLPPPVLRLLSGSGVTYLGGRTLDPRLQFLAAQGRATPPMSTMTPEEARRAEAGFVADLAGPPELGVSCRPLDIPAPHGAIPARLYTPDTQDGRTPVMVFAHMGGGVIGGLPTVEAFCGRLARVGAGPVISVDYRLAPEHRFPAGYEDVLTTYRWARENAEQFGAPSGQAAIGGDSMGGGFAASICQELKRLGEPQPVLQLLIYPCVDVASEAPSMTTYAEAFPLSRATMDWFASHYMGPDADPADPRLSPSRSEDLSGLAPAVVAVAGFDPLLDQGQAYARRLAEAGVPVSFRAYDSLSHAFLAFSGLVPVADMAVSEIAELVAARMRA